MDRGPNIVAGRKLVFGMVHLRPLPSTPHYEDGSFEGTLARAVRSATALREGGADGCLVQTVDEVYSVADESDPTRTAAMALIVRAVVEATAGDGFAVGVQMMRNAVSASLGVATVAGGAFVRASVLVGARQTPDGLVKGNPLAVAAYRRKLGAPGVGLIAEVGAMQCGLGDEARSLGDVARDAGRAGADAVAVADPDPERAVAKVAAVRAACPGLPVFFGGGTDHDNAERLLAGADGAFVGRCLEPEGWGTEIDVERTRAYVDIVRSLES